MSEKLADEREAKVEARQRKEGSKTPGSRFKNPRKQRELCLQKTEVLLGKFVLQKVTCGVVGIRGNSGV